MLLAPSLFHRLLRTGAAPYVWNTVFSAADSQASALMRRILIHRYLKCHKGLPSSSLAHRQLTLIFEAHYVSSVPPLPALYLKESSVMQ